MSHYTVGRYGLNVPTREHPEAASPERANDIQKALEELKRFNAEKPRRRPKQRARPQRG